MKEGANIWTKVVEGFTEDRKIKEAQAHNLLCASLVESENLWSMPSLCDEHPGPSRTPVAAYLNDFLL